MRYAVLTERWNQTDRGVVAIADTLEVALANLTSHCDGGDVDTGSAYHVFDQHNLMGGRGYLFVAGNRDRLVGILPLDGYVRCTTNAIPAFDYGYLIDSGEDGVDLFGKDYRVVYVPTQNLDHQTGRNASGGYYLRPVIEEVTDATV